MAYYLSCPHQHNITVEDKEKPKINKRIIELRKEKAGREKRCDYDKSY